MNTAIVTADEFDTIQRVAKAMVASGYFQDARDVAQAAIKIMAGSEMGLPPFAAMTNIHIIQGRPALGANLIATLIKNDPRYDYRVTDLTDEACSITFYEQGQQVGVSRFTTADAKKAATKNMDKFPRNMLFARAISNGARWYTPGIFGGTAVYTPEELGAAVDEEGYILPGELVVEPEPAQLPAPANGKAPEPGPLPDDEQVIADSIGPMGFMSAVAELLRIPPSRVKEYMVAIRHTSIPRDPDGRIALYHQIAHEHTEYQVSTELLDEADLDATTEAVSPAAQ
jgi:hypothetical protein